MNFPPFWAKGASGDFSCWGWSAKSMAEAQSLAVQAAERQRQRYESNNLPAAHGGYYPNRPFREPILQEIKNDAGEISAVVTRNSYGCQVLNTSRVMFVDIDLPEPRAGGFLQKLFGKPNLAKVNPQGAALEKIESWTRAHPEWGWRIYRTRAGLRLLATHALVDADSATASEVFDALGSDPLYQTLCRTQKCFRARLTPKPWRCGVRAKPELWPFADARAESKFNKWELYYQSLAFNWATCELLKSVGNAASHPEVQAIIKIHDSATRIESRLQLA